MATAAKLPVAAWIEAGREARERDTTVIAAREALGIVLRESRLENEAAEITEAVEATEVKPPELEGGIARGGTPVCDFVTAS